MGRRLLVAVLLIAAVWLVCYLVLPRYGLWLPAEVPALVSLVMLLAALVAWPQPKESRPADEPVGPDADSED